MPMWDTLHRGTLCTGKYSRGSKKLCTVCSLIILSATNQNKDHGELYRARWIPDYSIIIHLKTTGYDWNFVVMNSLLYLHLNCPFFLVFILSENNNNKFKTTQQQNSFSRFSTSSFFNFQGFQGPFQNKRLFQGFQGF